VTRVTARWSVLVLGLAACHAAAVDQPEATDDSAAGVDRVDAAPDHAVAADAPGTEARAQAPIAPDASALDRAPAPDGPRVIGKQPVFVAVGDKGRIVRSLDLGKTWVDSQLTPDGDGLSWAAWGNGVFVTSGHERDKAFYSADGKTWTPADKSPDNWVGNAGWGNGRFVAAGGYGGSWYSTDGRSWTKSKVFRDGGDGARSLAFGNGVFTAATDKGNWWRSTDGEAWTRLTDCVNQPTECHKNEVAFCGGDFMDAVRCTTPEGHGRRPAFGEGVWVTTVNGLVERSENGGATWQRVPGVGGAGDMYLQAIVFGYAP
jgi:hypothetical protein